MDNRKSGTRFLTWLARAAIEVRERAQARPEEIAAPLKVGVDKIRRFEAAKTLPQDAERVLAAYAAIAGLDDPRELYRRALELWYEHGSAPELHPGEDGTPLTEHQTTAFAEQLHCRSGQLCRLAWCSSALAATSARDDLAHYREPIKTAAEDLLESLR